MERQLEYVLCACGVRDEKQLFYASDKMFPGPERFSAVRCRRCGLVYLNPRPAREAHAAFYGGGYYCSADNAARAQPLEHYRPVIEFLEAERKSGAPGRVLDIGTGNSPFLPRMRELGWQVGGTEVDADLVDLFSKRHQIELYHGELEDAGLAGGSFDAVTVMGVLEHVPNPRSLLEEACRVLRPDGVMGLWCFNRSIEADLLGRFWLGFDTPRHLYSFSRRTLERLLKETGFVVEKLLFPPVNYLFYSGVWAAVRLRRRFRGGVHDPSDSGQPVYVPTLPFLLEKASLPLGILLAKMGRSSNMYVFARKRGPT